MVSGQNDHIIGIIPFDHLRQNGAGDQTARLAVFSQFISVRRNNAPVVEAAELAQKRVVRNIGASLRECDFNEHVVGSGPGAVLRMQIRLKAGNLCAADHYGFRQPAV